MHNIILSEFISNFNISFNHKGLEDVNREFVEKFNVKKLPLFAFSDENFKHWRVGRQVAVYTKMG